MQRLISALSLFVIGALPTASADFDTPDPVIDALVEQCLATEGVNVLPETDVICYNSPIFPEQFIALNTLPDASRIIITSPGGNVATARTMSGILDKRAEPVTIAGQCMSACAMVILPGLEDIHIHRSAHIAVHGITMMPYNTWYGWLKGDVQASTAARLAAQFGYDFKFMMHQTGSEQMTAHLEAHDIDTDYIQSISDRMQADADQHDCRVDAKDYWGMLDAAHLRQYLGDRVTKMEAFAQSWDDPNNQLYKDVIKPLGPQTYIFEDDYAEATCP